MQRLTEVTFGNGLRNKLLQTNVLPGGNACPKQEDEPGAARWDVGLGGAASRILLACFATNCSFSRLAATRAAPPAPALPAHLQGQAVRLNALVAPGRRQPACGETRSGSAPPRRPSPYGPPAPRPVLVAAPSRSPPRVAMALLGTPSLASRRIRARRATLCGGLPEVARNRGRFRWFSSIARARAGGNLTPWTHTATDCQAISVTLDHGFGLPWTTRFPPFGFFPRRNQVSPDCGPPIGPLPFL
jgi:hypothetical protein